MQNKFDTLKKQYNDLQSEYEFFRTTIAEAITEEGVITTNTNNAEIMAENINKINKESISISVTTSYQNNCYSYFNFDVIDYSSVTVSDWLQWKHANYIYIAGEAKTSIGTYDLSNYEGTVRFGISSNDGSANGWGSSSAVFTFTK